MLANCDVREDNPKSTVVQDKLFDEKNYVVWARAIRMWLVFSQKMCFVNDQIPKPFNNSSKEYEASEMINEMVLQWTNNSVEKHVVAITLKDMKEMFNQSNDPLLYHRS